MQNNQPVWLDRQAYPFRSQYMRINQHRLHFIDEGQGEPILFVHGTPSWSYDFREIIKNLSATYRCVALDHIGFGLSDKPADYDYSIQNHCSTLEYVIETLRLENITLVVHDFGGPIGFHYAEKYPENINRIIVLNSWLWDFSGMPAFKAFEKLANSPLLPFLYKRLNFSAKVLLPKSFGAKKLDRTNLRNYTKPFAKASERLGPLAFAKSLISDQAWFEGLWENRMILQSRKILFIWGMADKVVTPDFLTKFADGFPHSRVLQLETCGHFPQEEEAEAVIKAVQTFLNEEKLNAPVTNNSKIAI